MGRYRWMPTNHAWDSAVARRHFGLDGSSATLSKRAKAIRGAVEPPFEIEKPATCRLEPPWAR
jgi:hypothetical protein